MIKNHKGFTVVETLLVIIALAIIGFGGYYVWRTQHKTKAATTTTSTTLKTVAKPATPVDPYAGWKVGALKYEQISYKYPSNWTLTDSSTASPKSSDGCTYPGEDRATLKSPSNETVILSTGIYCIGDGGSVAFSSMPINSLGQNVFLVLENTLDPTAASPTSPLFACLAKTSSPTTPLEFTSKNIFSNGSGGDPTWPRNTFCFYPYDPASIQNGNFPSETVSSISNSSDFATAKLIFESMHY